MKTPSGRGLPGVLALLLAAGLFLVAPVALVTRSSLQEMSEQLEAADSIEQTADSVQSWLRLGTALSGEASATSAVLVTKQLPPAIRPMIDTDVEAALAQTRREVDLRVADLAPLDLGDDIEATRMAIDAGDLDHNGSVAALLDISASVSAQSRAEFVSLIVAAGEIHGGSVVARNAEVARLADQMSVRTSDAAARWGGLVSPTDPPTAAEIESFVGAVALWRESEDAFGAALDPESDTAVQWQDLRSSQNRAVLDLVYRLTLDEVAPAAPLDTSTSSEPLEMTPELIVELQIVNGVLDAFTDVVVSSYELADAAVDDVEEANLELQQEASNGRQRALIVFGILTTIIIAVAVVLGVVVVRPLRRMSDVIASLGRGELGMRAQVAGPRELRTTSIALNDALDSLQRAESKALALAEERLDDPVLSTETSGPLAASLDAAVAQLASRMSESDEFRRQLAHEATHDGLTKLANRNAVIDRLQAAMDSVDEAGSSVALLYFDLDGFKSVNDVHGHHTGDHLLGVVAQRLRNAIGSADVAGRVGGDEFVVVMTKIASEADAVRAAERVLASISEPIVFGDTCIDPSLSIGVALHRRPGATADELLREADLALYRAKELGGHRVEFCDDALRIDAAHRSGLDRAVLDGLEAGEFELYFQPIIDSGTGFVRSLEALVRWNRGPDVVDPVDFIPHAERSDLVVQIDRWTSRAAIAQAAEWLGDPLLAGIPISVNTSGRYVAGGNLADEFSAALAGSGVAPSQLMIEVTESAVLTDLKAAVEELDRLRRIGVRIALDDFGSGFTSLTTLRRLDVDVLKIDRSIVSGIDQPTERSLVELMVRAGHLLNTDVVAEGIETIRHARMLTDLGCDGLQGFLFAAPVRAGDIAAVLDRLRSELFGPETLTGVIGRL